MTKNTASLELFIDKVMKLQAGQRFLIVTDSGARPRNLGKTVMELTDARKIETVMMVMSPRTHQGHEPPKLIAQAMKNANVILEVVDRYDCTHTTARMEASAAGAKYFLTSTGISEDYLQKKMTIVDLKTIRDLTNRLAQRLTQASIAKVTTPFGTDVSMDIEGRPGLSLHPLHDAAVSMLPDYAEAAISPNEGTTQGCVVVDAAIQEWGYILQEPLRIVVTNGRIESVEGGNADVKRFKEMIAKDENAGNFVAELGIGTSHTISGGITGSVWDFARKETVHMAVGRNNDIGGATLSQIHKDLLMTKPTIELDGKIVLKNGSIMI